MQTIFFQDLNKYFESEKALYDCFDDFENRYNCKKTCQIYNIFTNINSSGSYKRNIISYLVEMIFESEDNDLSIYQDAIWFCNFDENRYATPQRCKSVLSGIYWLTTKSDYIVTSLKGAPLRRQMIYDT